MFHHFHCIWTDILPQHFLLLSHLGCLCLGHPGPSPCLYSGLCLLLLDNFMSLHVVYIVLQRCVFSHCSYIDLSFYWINNYRLKMISKWILKTCTYYVLASSVTFEKSNAILFLI